MFGEVRRVLKCNQAHNDASRRRAQVASIPQGNRSPVKHWSHVALHERRGQTLASYVSSLARLGNLNQTSDGLSKVPGSAVARMTGKPITAVGNSTADIADTEFPRLAFADRSA